MFCRIALLVIIIGVKWLELRVKKMKKNKKLLILVSCLLLVGGISFAYFLASTIFSGEA